MTSSDHIVDPRYEFCAPQYHDFTAQSDDEEVDSWFGTDTVSGLCSPIRPPRDGDKGAMAHNPPDGTVDGADDGIDDEQTVGASSEGEQGTPRESGAIRRAGSEDVVTRPETRSMARANQAGGRPVNRSKGAQRARGTSVDESSAENSENAKTKRSHQTMWSTDMPKTAWENKLTVPVSPKFQKLQKKNADQLTTEEREYMKAQEEAMREAKRRRVQGERVKKLLAGGSHGLAPHRSTAQLTMPEEFTFRTGARAGRVHGMTTRSMTPEGKGARRRSESGRRGSEGHVPLAEAVCKFHSKTPQRYRTRPRGANQGPEELPSPPRGLTQPVSPRLRAGGRGRNAHLKSTEQRELEALAAVPRFRAREVDARVMESCGDYGVPRVEKRGVTVPMDVPLATAARGGRAPPARPAEDDLLAESHRFRAGELDQRMLAGPTFVPEPQDAKVTVPQSPALATRTRAGERAALEALVGATEADVAGGRARQFTARPLPAETTPPCSKPRPPRAPVQPEPFSLATDCRGEAYRAELKRAREAEEAEAAAKRQRHARPLPSSHDAPSALPAVDHQAPTVPEPFHMPGESIHSAAEARRQEKMAQEAEEARRAREFHARPSKATAAAPFQPAKSSAPLTEVQNINLRSNARSKQRADFDEKVRRKEEAAAEARRRAEEERAAAEAREVAEARKAAVPRARGVPDFSKPFKPQLSTRSLTQPRAPKLSTARRPATRAMR